MSFEGLQGSSPRVENAEPSENVSAVVFKSIPKQNPRENVSWIMELPQRSLTSHREYVPASDLERYHIHLRPSNSVCTSDNSLSQSCLIDELSEGCAFFGAVPRNGPPLSAGFGPAVALPDDPSIARLQKDTKEKLADIGLIFAL